MHNRRPIAVDLFAGAGGLSLGLEQAGFDVKAAVEFDPIHAAIHELNFPEAAVICNDVSKVSGASIRRAAGLIDQQIDLVAGGPPCQGFSLIGHRQLSDSRNSLVFHFLRLVKELQPKYFVMENVPGMATGDHSGLLHELISQFGEIGYEMQLPYRILNAANFGVPQARRRLFLIGAKKGLTLPQYPNLKTSIRGKSPVEGLNPSPSVGEAIADLPDIDRFEKLLDSDVLDAPLRAGSNYARTLRGEILEADDFSYPRKTSGFGLSGCKRALHTGLSRRRFSATAPGQVEPISRFLKLDPSGVCNTLRAGTASDRGAFSAPRPIHPKYPRCISVREAARLHSFPDWFRFHATIWHGFREIGNSVPPKLGRAVGAAVVGALGLAPRKPRRTLILEKVELANITMKEAAAHFGLEEVLIKPRRRLVATNG
jgi:DNA (cytosine-5)-methyltransferase 1